MGFEMPKENENIPVDLDEILRLTVDVTMSYLNNNSLPASEVPDFMHLIHTSLSKLHSNEKTKETQQLKPAVSIRKSITDKHLVCLEDGKQLKMLKRHLRTAYNLSPEEYRAKWNLPSDYPMVAPGYAAQRSAFAKKIGLGKSAPGQNLPSQKLK